MTKKHYFDKNEYLYSVSDDGYFGEFGGQFVPPAIKDDLDRISVEFKKFKNDENFLTELYSLLVDYAGRKSPLYFAKRLIEHFGGAKIYLKREDLNHTGAHKINNTLGQIFLAQKIGKKKIIAETGAEQHGVATATAAALFGMPCDIYMGEVYMERQISNVRRMEMLGTRVVPIKSGSRTLKEAVDEAVDEAFLAYLANVKNIYYMIGSAVGPAPYPEMVRFFQSVIGNEMKEQIMEKEGKLPNYVIACAGGGSNSIGAFYSFTGDKNVRLLAAEAAGKGVDIDKTAATLTKGEKIVLRGFKTYAPKDKDENVAEAHSISAGLDYPGIGPEIAHLRSIGRIETHAIADEEVVEAFHLLLRTEGIIPAIKSARAVAVLPKIIKNAKKDEIIEVNISRRGDKD
ncbi:MAG: tryptophan synthase subunit beta [Rickettsiales bacterium]|nr:tryptophan synthase subunit beta [Rickettsiales bacterium]